jgi:hypothetical protein
MEWTKIFSVVGCALATSAGGVALGYIVAMRLRKLLFVDDDTFMKMLRRTAEQIRSTAGTIPSTTSTRSTEYRVDPNYLLDITGDTLRAIGLGLVTNEEIAAAGDESLAQSKLAFGIIVPLSLLLYALALRLQFSLGVILLIFLIALVSDAVLFIVGIDRFYKHRLELRSLILGSFEKKGLEQMTPTEQTLARAKSIVP